MAHTWITTTKATVTFKTLFWSLTGRHANGVLWFHFENFNTRNRFFVLLYREMNLMKCTVELINLFHQSSLRQLISCIPNVNFANGNTILRAEKTFCSFIHWISIYFWILRTKRIYLYLALSSPSYPSKNEFIHRAIAENWRFFAF